MISPQFKKILDQTIENNASDLHISVGHPPILRISKELVDLEKEKIITREAARELADSLMNDCQKEKFLKEKEVDFGFDFEGKARFRVNVYLESGNVSIALRLVSPKIRTIEEDRKST